ncbi:MAG: glycosyltransferase family 9 protein [Elusimicrobia bacterium]|nr:glycosyltransferase family 9 protein [Elusimicrobiota bacterium]
MAKKILIIVLKAIGDVLLTTPLIRALKKGIPGSEVWFLTEKASEKILRHNPYLSGIILRNNDTLKEIRKQEFDTVIDFMHSAISGYYTLFSGAKQRIATYRPWGFWCYNVMPKIDYEGYTVFKKLKMLDIFKVKDDGTDLDFVFGKENEKKVLDFFKRENITKNDFVVTFDITNKKEHRQWQKEKFARLADLIAEKLNGKIIFLWGPGEVDHIKNAMSLCKRKHIYSDDFDVLDLAALTKNCSMHIGTSSAPMHIAVSQKIPSFTVYGLKDGPDEWGPPQSDNVHGYIQDDFNILSVDKVFEKFIKFYNKLKVSK